MSRELNEIKKLAGLTQLNEYYIYADEEEDPIGKKINDIDRGEMDDLVKKSTAPDPENVKTPMPPMRPGPEPARSPEDKEIGKVLKNAPPGIKMRTIEQNVSASGPWASKPAAPKEVDNRPIPYNPQATAPAASKEVDNRPIPFRPKADTSDIELPGGGTTPYSPPRSPPATAMTGEKDTNPFGKTGSQAVKEVAKPDYIDADDDGNTVEPMKKALADKERSDESLSWMKRLAGLSEGEGWIVDPTTKELTPMAPDDELDNYPDGETTQTLPNGNILKTTVTKYPAPLDPQDLEIIGGQHKAGHPGPAYDPFKGLMMNKDDALKAFGAMKGVREGAKPDYIDADNDGNEEEPMKKALSDKERSDESLYWMRKLAGLQEALPVFAQPMPNAPKTIKKASAGTPAFADTPSATSSIITPSSVERAAARQAASSNDDSSAIDAAIDSARQIDPETISKEKSWDEKSWDEMTPADKKKYHEVYPPEAPEAHSTSASDDYNPYDALTGGSYDDTEVDAKPNPNAEWLAKQSPEWKRAAAAGELDATGNAAWTNNDPVQGNPILQPSMIAKYGPNPRNPDNAVVRPIIDPKDAHLYTPDAMQAAIKKAIDVLPASARGQVAESKGILDREQHIAWLQKILDSTNTK
jgi:hypothetical protein